MKDKLWAKTLLCVYRYLERVSGAIDKIMLQKGLSSGHMTSLTMSTFSSESVANSMIDLMERKVTLINLKVLIEDSLASMKEKDAEVLIDKFVCGLKTRELVEKHNSSMRNIFRKIDGALSSFENQLSIRGYDEQKLQKMTSGEEWIQNAYRRFENREQDVVLSKISLARAVR